MHPVDWLWMSERCNTLHAVKCVCVCVCVCVRACVFVCVLCVCFQFHSKFDSSCSIFNMERLSPQSMLYGVTIKLI